MPAHDVITTFEQLSAQLESAAASARMIGHSGRMGAERELLLKEHLERFIPERYSIGRGEILAANGAWSRDEDLLIYDRISSPKLFSAKESLVLPVEGVAAVVEVKSSFGTRELKEASRSIASAKSLQKSGQRLAITQFGMTASPARPVFGAVFAYGLRIRPRLFFEHWLAEQNSLPPQERTDMLCVLNDFVIFPSGIGRPAFAAQAGTHSLLTFTLVLLHELSEFTVPGTNIWGHVFSGDRFLEFPAHPDSLRANDKVARASV